ncbi:hypothetical protein QYM36_015659 [Artemia franciscana]|uniref:Uncharacterized protein n=2 Tax=Artemia franciscana TaxID=6661 RepID=A0AA88L0B7_ARTSF|nr:hypothetical protein QYM36_015659 [Artemia franciscana]
MWPNQVKLPELSLKHLQIPIRSNKKKEPAKLMTKPSEKKKLKYCQCLKLEIEVPHEKETMESLFELCYIGYTDAKNIDSLVDALLEYEIDSPIQDIAEKAIDSLKPFTVENLLKKARRLLQGEVDSEVAKTIMRKVKTRKDFPKFTKHLPLKMLIEYIDDNELTSEDQNTIIVDRLENVDDQEKQVEKNKINQLIDNLDLERMNCSELERLTNVLAQRQIDTRTVLQKVMQMSLKGTGKCHSACGECLREYLYNTKFHYEPGQWNTTTLLKPQSIKGQEAMLGSFLIDEEEFITVFQRDALSSDDSCVDGLVLYRQTKGNRLNPVAESEFDMEIIIDPKGKDTHDCPLRNRLRYKFDHRASTYKWNTKIDFGQPQDVYIKMNPVK